MRTPDKTLLRAAMLALIGGHGLPAGAQTITEAVGAGDVSGLFNLRWEDVEQGGALPGASALTLRSTLRYASGVFEGFSATLEVEDVRSVAGADSYTVAPSGFNPGRYATIADPETTELNQGFLQYAAGAFSARLGRQVIIHDNHRFVGTVAWRQDWQTFDAFSLDYAPRAGAGLSYHYLDKRERVFAEDADIDSSDHLLRGSLTTPIGALTAYAYLLETDAAVANSLDTWGLRLSGARKLGGHELGYVAEYAVQESRSGPLSFDADYLLLEGGLTVRGLSGKLGVEVLGSDGAAYGFSTPLATLHAFNGWADMFPATPAVGLRDAYASLGGAMPGAGGNWSVILHDYAADASAAQSDDLGREINLQYTRVFADDYTLGLKFADYRDAEPASLPDTRKYWMWLQARF